MRAIIDQRLWIGNARDAREPRALFEQGVVAVVDLAAEEPAAALPRDLAYCRFPLSDGVGNPPAIVEAAVAALCAFLINGTPTLASCGAGMSRAPAIVAAALARAERTSFEAALAKIRERCPTDVSPGFAAEVEWIMEGVGRHRESPTM